MEKLTAYLPKRGDGSAFVVCPGGGYAHLAPHEGEPVAKWLAELGIATYVLSYRHAPQFRHPAPLEDVMAAIRWVRGQGGIDRVGVLGFSAGGHLAASASTMFVDEAGRPDLSVLCYPVISFVEPCAHIGSRENLLGPDAPHSLMEIMSPERRVTAETPPAFLFHTADDPGVPVENSLLYAAALRRAKVPFELHIYEHGRHGVGLAGDDPVLSTWTGLCARWLAMHGFGKFAGVTTRATTRGAATRAVSQPSRPG